jgi:hypothetical protein
VADVGHHQREEVDRVPRGAAAALNFGWPCREGTIPGPRDCAGSFVDPVVEYDHGGGRCAVTGGYVVRDHDIDSVYGRYLYVDLCGGDVRGALVGPGGVTDDAPTGLVMPRVFTFGEDGCGHLYLGREDGTVAELLEDRYETPKPCPEPKRPPAEPPARDRVAPRLTVARRFRQHLAPHRSLYVTVRCSERCAVTAAARIRVPGRAAPLKAARTLPSLARGRRVTVRLLLAPRAASAARRAMNAGKALRGRIRVTARDAAGNRSVRTRPVLVFP